MTSHQDPGTGLAAGLGQPQRVRFLPLRVTPSDQHKSRDLTPGSTPAPPGDQQEPRTVSPVNPPRHNPRTHSPATATASNRAGPNTRLGQAGQEGCLRSSGVGNAPISSRITRSS
jgi:hypothetical protein